MAVLRTGSQGQEVRDLQRALTAAGYKVGIDGTYGPETKKAVMAYQKANGLSVDGEVGKDTKGNLQVPFLRVGDSGDRVKALQRDLKRSGEAVKVDGQFGPETKKAVQNFQTNAGIGVDGVVGNETYGELAKTIPIPTPRPNMAAEAATDTVPDTGQDMAGGPEEPSVPLNGTPTEADNLQKTLAGANPILGPEVPLGMDRLPAPGQKPFESIVRSRTMDTGPAPGQASWEDTFKSGDGKINAAQPPYDASGVALPPADIPATGDLAPPPTYPTNDPFATRMGDGRGPTIQAARERGLMQQLPPDLAAALAQVPEDPRGYGVAPSQIGGGPIPFEGSRPDYSGMTSDGPPLPPQLPPEGIPATGALAPPPTYPEQNPLMQGPTGTGRGPTKAALEAIINDAIAQEAAKRKAALEANSPRLRR